MERMRLVVFYAAVLLAAASATAQPRETAGDPVSGTWGQDGKAFLELTFDGKRDVTGTTIWRAPHVEEVRAPIESGSFDSRTATLKIEGHVKRPDSGAVVRYTIEGTVDHETLSGTYVFGDDKGDFQFRKMRRER